MPVSACAAAASANEATHTSTGQPLEQAAAAAAGGARRLMRWGYGHGNRAYAMANRMYW